MSSPLVIGMEKVERIQSGRLFEAIIGVSLRWYVRKKRFDADGRALTTWVGLPAASRLNHPEAAWEHPACNI